MRLIDLLRSTGGAFAHRARAFLTVLGVSIGTGSIVLLASLLHGGQRALTMTNREASGDDIVEVHRDDPPPRTRERTTRPLSRDDAAAITAGKAPRAGGARALVAPEGSFDAWARLDGRRKRVAVVSAGADTLALYRLSIAKGRALDDDDRVAGRRVCVVGDEVYAELARSAPLADLRLTVEGELFAVVGVLAPKPSLDATDGTYLWSRKVLVPETTYDALHSPSHEVDRIYVRSSEPRATVRSFVRGLVLRRHLGVANFALADDAGSGNEELILASIEVLLLGTGLLAMLAAGINIMNVMLVTVAERAREIGLRRALGATRRSVQLQFTLEAAALSSAGGAVGLVGGVGAAGAIALLARSALGAWQFAIPPWSIALGLALALATGVAFGALPAWRASRLSPMDALRTD